jgi:cell division protein FtsI (penicillin-binding protein 3)
MRSRYRMAGMLATMGIAFAAVGGKLVIIQGVSADRYLALGRSERIRSVELPGDRGSIFDRNGRELALSIPQITLWTNPHLVTDPRREAEDLAPILGQSVADLQTKLSRDAGFVYLARKVDDNTAAKAEALKLDGVFSLQEPKRFLPDGELATPLLGTVGTDNTGLSGLEHQYDRVLSGRAGKLIEESDPRGSEIPGGLHQYRPAARGDDLVLTIDQSLQYETEQALAAEIVAADAKGGMAMVMDSKTGDLLAAANLVRSDGTPASPLTMSAPSASTFTQVYEPGSVNKLVTISAALQTGLIRPSDRFMVPDTMRVGDATFRDAEPHPPAEWTVTDILANSSNIGTIMIAQRLGKDRIDQSLRAFGFGHTTDLGFPGESAGLLLDPRKWSATSIGTVPIGQGVAVTATQMLAAYNTIANGGEYVAPRLVKATIDAGGRQHPAAPSPLHRVVSPEVARQMTTMLGEVVRVGTGRAAAVAEGYTTAGKTGTARKPLIGARGYMDGVYVSSFAGFVPAGQPALTGIVILDETAQFGGAAAAPVFATIARYGLREFRIPPPPPVGPAPGVPLATDATARAAGEIASPPVSRPVTPTTAPSQPGQPPARPGQPVRPSQPTTTTTTLRGTTTTVATRQPPAGPSPPPTSTTRPATH